MKMHAHMIHNARLACLGLGGLLLGWAGLGHKFTGPLESSILQIETPSDAHDCLEADRVHLPFALYNSSNAEASVTKLVPSCGCIEILRREHEKLELPFVLAAGSRLPLSLVVDATGREGVVSHSIGMQFESQGNPGSAGIDFSLFVRPALRNLTGPLFFDGSRDGEHLAAEVLIGDGYPDPGIALGDVISPIPGSLTASLERLDSSSTIDIIESEDAGRCEVKQRYRLNVQVKRDARSFQAYLTVRPRHDRFKALHVPVYYRNGEDRTVVSPREVVVGPAMVGKTISRSVRYCPDRHGASDNLSKLTIKKCPTFISGVIESDDDGATVRLAITVPTGSGADRDRSVVVVANAEGEVVAEIPVIVFKHSNPDLLPKE